MLIRIGLFFVYYADVVNNLIPFHLLIPIVKTGILEILLDRQVNNLVQIQIDNGSGL